MKQRITEHKWKIITGAMILILIIVFLGIGKLAVTRNYYPIALSGSGSITCTFPQMVNTYYLENKINDEIPKKETNPIIFKFSNFTNSQIGQLDYIDSMQTITTVPTVKVVDKSDKIIFLDGEGDSYFSTYTIFKGTGLAIYTKSVDFLGDPRGTIAMGTCVGF